MKQIVGVAILLTVIIAVGLTAATARVQTISGFTGFVLNGGATSTASALTLTDNAGNEARSGFYDTRLAYGAGFAATFTYTPSGNKNADGVAFILQNNVQGANAIGPSGIGGGLGYGGMATSAAIEFNIYTSYKIGSASEENGVAGIYNATGAVTLNSGDPIAVTLTYNNGLQTLTESLFDATANTSYSTSYTTNLSAVSGGGFAYVGFSGGTGSGFSTQTITNFTYNGAASAPEPSGIALFSRQLCSSQLGKGIAGWEGSAAEFRHRKSYTTSPSC